MLASDFFTQARLQEMREEICRDGFVADKFLGQQPDCPVFGVNLACLYPFPDEAHEVYETLFTQLSSLDSGIYVYPLWETHVTIATFINFTQHLSPARERVDELKKLARQIVARLGTVFTDIKPFDLWIERPVISRKAAILPLSDPTDAIAQIRTRVAENLARDPSLQTTLSGLGLNIPPLIHSTIMRFKKAPEDRGLFLSKFDEIASNVPRVSMRVDELYITTETKPYMREGSIFHQFPL